MADESTSPARPVPSGNERAGHAGVAASDAPVIRVRADGLLDVEPPSPGAIVRYTLDGSDPGQDAGVWLAPVSLPAGYTLKARAFTANGDAIGNVTIREAPPAASRTPSTLVPVTQNRDWQLYDWAERHAASGGVDEEPAARDRDARRLDHPFLGRGADWWPPDRCRTSGIGSSPAARGEPGLRVGSHRERSVAAHARRVRQREPESRRRDDRHQQHRSEYARRDYCRHSRHLRGTASPRACRATSCCSASSRAARGRTRRAPRSARSTNALRGWMAGMG